MGTEGVGGCAIRKRYKIMLVGNFCGFLKPSTHTYWTRNRSEFTFTCTSPCPPPRFTCCGAGHEWSQQKKQTKNSPRPPFAPPPPTPRFRLRWAAQWLSFSFISWSCLHTATGAFINQRTAVGIARCSSGTLGKFAHKGSAPLVRL